MRLALQAVVRVGCLVLLGAGVGSAQPAGQLTGVVRDTTGSVLPGVTMTVSSAALSPPRAVVTDGHGGYVLEALPPGRCLVTAAFSGFEPWLAEVELRAGTTTLDVVLAVSPFSQEVTVTATRTGVADVHTTPVAITVLPSRLLDQLGIQTVEGLRGVVPSVTISQHTGLALVTIRGIGTNSTIAGADPSSTVHLDGVYLGRPAMVFTDFLNVERVEVLRGPQGTLYGRNSVGGTINIVTRQPINTFDASARVTAGNYDTFRVESTVGGPLVKDKVLGNVAFLRSSRQGFVQDLDHPGDPLGGEDTWAGRGYLRVIFGARTELLLSGDYAQYNGIPLTYAKPVAAKPGFTFDNPSSLWAVRTSHPTTGKNIQQGASAKMTVRLDPTTTLTSLTAYRKSNHRFFIDADGTELQLQTANVPDLQHQVSEELTFVRRLPALTWIAGAFFFDDRNEGLVEITMHPADLQIRPFARISTNARALYGEATYKVSTRVSLTGGARYTYERKDLDNAGGVYHLGTAVLAIPGSLYAVVDSVTYHAWTPKGSVQMEVSPATFVYASATRGFKSGGFNPTASQPGLAFSPEYAWSYEGGLKHTTAGGRMRVNAAMFYSDYRDLQVQSFIRPGVPDVRNAASATIKGVETEVTAWAGRGLQLSGHFSWLDATYDRYLAVAPGGATGDVAGNRLNNVPEWSGSTSAAFEFAASDAVSAFVSGDVAWQSRVFFTPFNDGIETQRAYGLVHLRTGLGPTSRRWELTVFVRNVTNQEYIIGTANVPLPAFTAHPGAPRHWGTQFTIRR